MIFVSASVYFALEVTTIVLIIVGVAAWAVVVYFTLKTIEEFQAKKQRRGYREEDDIGRRQEEPK